MIGVEWNWASAFGLLLVPGQLFWYSGPSKSTSVPRHPPIWILCESDAAWQGTSSPSGPAGSVLLSPAQVALVDVEYIGWKLVGMFTHEVPVGANWTSPKPLAALAVMDPDWPLVRSL